jgi:hypothetical protein
MNKLQLQVFTMGMAKRGWNGKPGCKMISGLKNRRGGGRGRDAGPYTFNTSQKGQGLE